MTGTGRNLPAVSESLLAPLFAWAGEVLRGMEAQDVPPAARPLLSFDRRGFGNAAARAQLSKVLEAEDEFRARVLDAIAERDEVVALVEGWSAAGAVERARQALERDDLALLVSALVAAAPDDWQVGVGAAAALFDQGIDDRAVADDRRAFDVQVEKAEEAQRRAEARAGELEAELARANEELRSERASRREREDAVRAEVASVRSTITSLEAALVQAQEEAARAAERSGREAERAEGFDEKLRSVQAELAQERARVEGLEGDLVQAQREAEELRRRLDVALAAARGEAAPAPVEPEPEVTPSEPEPPKLTRRVPVALPPGVIGPSREGLKAAFAGGDPAVIVDGYNVSMLAWGDADPDVQRQRLCALLEGVHMRTQRTVTVVFDGADVEGMRPPRRPGVHVLFSAPGEEADDVVIRAARSMPLERPVIVVSSDRRVQQGAEAAGALAVPSPVFLEFIRK